MRLLIVEDEQKTANYLAKGLAENSFMVDVAYDGQDGYFKATHYNYDLIILDVMLPKIDGLQLLANLRSAKFSQRILLLTARDSIEDRVTGLELGADDYLVKPFAFSELLARVRTLLRREATMPVTKLVVADLHVDTIKHKVWRNNILIDLSAKELMLLVLLIQHTGNVLSRTFIAEKVWDIHFHCDTNIIDVAIRRLRQKIDDPFELKLIHTIRGRGYVLDPAPEFA